MGEIVQLWWEIVQNMCAVSIRASIASIMTIIGRKRRASVKISMRILLLVFLVKNKAWKVCQVTIPIIIHFVSYNILQFLNNRRNSSCTRASRNLCKKYQ